MAQEYFVIAIGGTGMRCGESLIHLCAMGMFDNTNIHLLALDTDKNNGNFGRLKELKEAYLNAKGLDAGKRVAHKDTFFSANIVYYEFAPNYEKNSSFSQVFNYGDTQAVQKEVTDLADLVLDNDVQVFNLEHGYRAQTHLGSMMMYQAIIEAAQSMQPNDLKSFINALVTQTNAGKARVFILGSVFGGTGASSIPIIPQALSKAAEMITSGATNILRSTYFGATLLTAYFSFDIPDAAQQNNQKIIARSERFALNSQVAMMFYDDDNTVKSIYQRFYMMGTPDQNWKPLQNSPAGQVLTGGSEQKNDSHYIELMAASAALDFLNVDENTLAQNKRDFKIDYLFRSIDDSGKFDFLDFVGKGRQTEFAQKFGTLIAFALFCNGKDDFVEKARNKTDNEIEGFETVDPSQVQNLKEYFNLFLNSFVESGRLEEGWLRQLHRSAEGGDRFLFNAKLFSPQTKKELMSLNWNDSLYKREGLGRDHKYGYTPIFGSRFNTFKDEFLRQQHGEAPQTITNRAEQLYKIIFDTLAKLYKFN